MQRKPSAERLWIDPEPEEFYVPADFAERLMKAVGRLRELTKVVPDRELRRWWTIFGILRHAHTLNEPFDRNLALAELALMHVNAELVCEQRRRKSNGHSDKQLTN